MFNLSRLKDKSWFCPCLPYSVLFCPFFLISLNLISINATSLIMVKWLHLIPSWPIFHFHLTWVFSVLKRGQNTHIPISSHPHINFIYLEEETKCPYSNLITSSLITSSHKFSLSWRGDKTPIFRFHHILT